MSSYNKYTKHPVTGNIERAFWIDDHFGRHRYGVRFASGEVFEGDNYEWETYTDEAYEQMMKQKHPMTSVTEQDDGKVVTERTHEDGRKDVDIKVTRMNIENRTEEDDIAEKKIIETMSKKTVSVLIVCKVNGDHAFLTDVKMTDVRLASLQMVESYIKSRKFLTILKIYTWSLLTLTHPFNLFTIVEIEDANQYPKVTTLAL